MRALGPEAGVGPGATAGLVAAAVALGGLAQARVALAEPKIQGIGDASVGYSDNIQSSPDTPVPGVAPKTPGAFVALTPGVVVASASPRAIHRLAYLFTYDLYFEQTNLSTASNQLDYHAFFDLSRRVNLTAGATAIQTNQYSALMLVPPGAGAVNASPSGSGSFLIATADELLTFDLSPDYRAHETLNVAEQTPVFDTFGPRTFVPAGRIGLDRTFRSDAVGAEARAEYSVVDDALALDGTPLGQQRQLIGTGVALWRHDWTREVTSRVEAGALRVQRMNTGEGLWQPTGTAALGYFTPFGDAEIAYDHLVTTNLLLGQTFLVDDARLRGALPVTKKREVVIAASAGYQRGQVLDQNLSSAARVDAILADAGVAWQATDLLLLKLRYQFVRQVSDAQVPPLPLSFVRNTVTIGATFRFPPEREMPRAYRAPQRVDGTDEVRDGAEPTQEAPPQAPAGGGT